MTAMGRWLSDSFEAREFRPPWAVGVPTVLPGFEEAFYLDSEARRARQLQREEEVLPPSPTAAEPGAARHPPVSSPPPPPLRGETAVCYSLATPPVRTRPLSARRARREEDEAPALDRCHLLYHQAIFASRESAELEEEIKVLKRQEEMRECTFKPKLLPARRPSSPAPQPRNFDSAVARMRAAARMREQRHEERRRIPCGENYERLRRLGTQPFSCYFKDGAHTRPPPLLYIDVSVGRGRTGRIGVHEGDDFGKLSRNFARAFQLDRETEYRLEELLYEAYEEQLRNLAAAEGSEGQAVPELSSVGPAGHGYQDDEEGSPGTWPDLMGRGSESDV